MNEKTVGENRKAMHGLTLPASEPIQKQAKMQLTEEEKGVVAKIASLRDAENEMRNAFGSTNPALFEAIADKLSGLERYDFGQWCHTVCHLFERYKKEGNYSLLRPETLGAAEKLIDEMVRRVVEGNETELRNVPRILFPVLEFNVDTIQDCSKQLPFRPKSLTSTVFIRLLGEAQKMKLLCTAKTAGEFISALTGINAQEAAENLSIAQGAKDLVEGMYVDVDGTLIHSIKAGEWWYGEQADKPFDVVDEKILKLMRREAETGKTVRIFSGGNPEEQTARLRVLGVDEKFLPVLPKSDFRGKILAEVIDDTPPQYQGFRALSNRY